MKKNIIKLGLFAILGTTTLVSCNRLLDTEDPSKISETAAVSTLEGLSKINQGLYIGNHITLSWYFQSLITDEVAIFEGEGGNTGAGTSYYSWVYGPGTIPDRDDSMDMFRGYYNAIRRANMTINNIDKIEATTSAELVTKDLLKAEALGLRAFNHYRLLKIFSPKYDANALGCAYVTTIDDFATPSRDNMKVSYEKVLADLDSALAIFPSSTDNDNTRINKSAIEALKAKIYLEIGEYDNAITFANKVLAKYSLTTAANYPNIWADSNDYKEVILKQTNLDSGGSTPGTLFFSIQNNVQYNASHALYSKFEDGDVRKTLFREISGKGIIPTKYLKPSFDGVKTNRGRADVKLIRTAEILLVRSEAYARKGDLTNAYTDYKALRDARNAGVSVAFTSQTDALDKILDERARELCYEGARLEDIKRFGKTIVRSNQDIRPNYKNLTFSDVDKYTLPIPQAEVFANRNIQQNRGW